MNRKSPDPSPPDAKNWGKLGLEEIVKITNKVGLAYVEAKKQADYYELLNPTLRAKVAIRIDDGKLTEAKLKRLTEMDDEYVEFLKKLSDAKSESNKLKVRYESYKNLFDARRSLLSYQKEEMKLI